MTTTTAPSTADVLEPTTTGTTLGVHSEVGRLRQAVVHRPGRELDRLTPSN